MGKLDLLALNFFLSFEDIIMRIAKTALLAGLFSLISYPLLANAATTDTTNNFTSSQQTQIKNIVHDYLIQNPQIILEAINKLQAQQEQQTKEQGQKAAIKYANALFNSSSSPAMGNANGTITLVAFFDYQCPYCKRMSSLLNELIKTTPNLRIVMKEWPILSESSALAARAALAAQQQGKYLALHNAFMDEKTQLSKDEIVNIAKQNGLDTTKLETAMSSTTVMNELKSNLMLATALGFSGTPAFVIAKTSPDANHSPNVNKITILPGSVSLDALKQVISRLEK